MNYLKLLKLLGKHPNDTFNQLIKNKPTEKGIYLSTKIFNNPNKFIFFNSTEELKEFMVCLVFSDLSILVNPNKSDYLEGYLLYQNLRKNSQIDKEFFSYLICDWGFIEIIDIGLVNDLISITNENLERIIIHKLEDIEEFEDLNISLTTYKIINSYINFYQNYPSKNINQFLNFLEGIKIEVSLIL
jgi:hypothetical protein